MAATAIVTGATGGLGKKFIEKISRYSDIDEIWATGRNKAKLEEFFGIVDKANKNLFNSQVPSEDFYFKY